MKPDTQVNMNKKPAIGNGSDRDVGPDGFPGIGNWHAGPVAMGARLDADQGDSSAAALPAPDGGGSERGKQMPQHHFVVSSRLSTAAAVTESRLCRYLLRSGLLQPFPFGLISVKAVAATICPRNAQAISTSLTSNISVFPARGWFASSSRSLSVLSETTTGTVPPSCVCICNCVPGSVGMCSGTASRGTV